MLIYDRHLGLKGVAALFTPLLGLSLRRIGDRAMVGLRACWGHDRGRRHRPACPGPGRRRRGRGHGGPEFQPHRHRAPPSAGGVGRTAPDERPRGPRHRGHVGHRPGYGHGLARLGAEMHIVGRDPRRGAEALGAVEAAGLRPAHLHLVDLSDPSAVIQFGKDLSDGDTRLDALVHNAGALTRTYQTTANGTERTVATQVFGPYLLTAALAPMLFLRPLVKRPPPRPPSSP